MGQNDSQNVSRILFLPQNRQGQHIDHRMPKLMIERAKDIALDKGLHPFRGGDRLRHAGNHEEREKTHDSPFGFFLDHWQRRRDAQAPWDHSTAVSLHAVG